MGSDAAMFSIRHLRTNEGFIKAGVDYAEQPRPSDQNTSGQTKLTTIRIWVT